MRNNDRLVTKVEHQSWLVRIILSTGQSVGVALPPLCGV